MSLQVYDKHIQGIIRNKAPENSLYFFGVQEVTLVGGMLKKVNEGQLQFFGCFGFERDGYRCDVQENITAISITAKINKNNLRIKTFIIELSTV